MEEDGTRTAATGGPSAPVQPAAKVRPSAEGRGFLKVSIGGRVQAFRSRICTDDADREWEKAFIRAAELFSKKKQKGTIQFSISDFELGISGGGDAHLDWKGVFQLLTYRDRSLKHFKPPRLA